MAYFKHGDTFSVKLKSAFNPRSYISDLSLDLKLILLTEFATVLFVGIPVLNGSFLRYILAFLLVMFVPGYALMAALFPKRNAITGLERFVFSFTASLAVIPLIGYVLNYTEWGVSLEPMLIAIIVFTTLCALYANKRRNDLPRNERYSADVKERFASTVRYVFPPARGVTDSALSMILILSVLALSITTAYVIMATGSQDKFTELYILGPDGKTGDYPTDFYTGHSQSVTAYVVNHEHTDMDYNLTVLLDNGQSRTPLYQTQFTLVHNQTWNGLIDLMPETIGNHQKLAFDLMASGYGDSPYRSVYLWVNVSPSEEPYTGLNVYGYNRSIPVSAPTWNLTQGKNFDVWVLNYEFRKVPYYFEVALRDDTSRTILYAQNMTLAHNQTWNKYLSLRPDRLGNNMTLEFNLYANGNMSTPYKFLDLTTNVTEQFVDTTGYNPALSAPATLSGETGP
jgi:uncharacterized membrane protein